MIKNQNRIKAMNLEKKAKDDLESIRKDLIDIQTSDGQTGKNSSFEISNNFDASESKIKSENEIDNDIHTEENNVDVLNDINESFSDSIEDTRIEEDMVRKLFE